MLAMAVLSLFDLFQWQFCLLLQCGNIEFTHLPNHSTSEHGRNLNPALVCGPPRTNYPVILNAI